MNDVDCLDRLCKEKKVNKNGSNVLRVFVGGVEFTS